MNEERKAFEKWYDDARAQLGDVDSTEELCLLVWRAALAAPKLLPGAEALLSAKPAQRTLLEQCDLDHSPEYQRGRADGRSMGYDVGYRHAREQAEMRSAKSPAADSSFDIRDVMDDVDSHAKACLDRAAGEPVDTAASRRTVQDSILRLAARPARREPMTEEPAFDLFGVNYNMPVIRAVEAALEIGRSNEQRRENSVPSEDQAHAIGATGSPAYEGERLAFEAWMRGHCWSLMAEWNGKGYQSHAEQGGNLCPQAMVTRRLWAAWRDRGALSRQVESQDDGVAERQIERPDPLKEKAMHAMHVYAEAHSDDRALEVEFNAEPYLAQASDQAISALIACGWGGDYPADAVAEHFCESNPDIKRLFDHLANIKDLRSHKDKCGFECYVNEDDGAAWVRANRPHLASRLEQVESPMTLAPKLRAS